MFAANVQVISTLPNAPVIKAMQLDAAGNIYLAGSLVPTGKNGTSAFVAEVSADGSKVVYFTSFGGSFNDFASSLTVGSDGTAYVGGTTNSSDFPITPGAVQSSFGAGGTQGFLAKVSPAGSVVYSTFIAGSATTQVTGVAMDGAGDVFLTGTGGPAARSNTNQPLQGFVLELDPGLSKVLLSSYGYGGGLITLDKQANIYLAGRAQAIAAFTAGLTYSLPPLPAGAFQSTHNARSCYTFGGGPGGPGGSIPCSYQYVAKLSATGTLLWGTYVTGTYGATPGGMSVDSAGNVIVAGTTNSDDYPVTPGAFQTAFAAAAPPYPVPVGSPIATPPPATGYVTKVNATGTGLIWSTYFGGSFADEITGMTVGPTGEIFVAGHADSSDLPALADTPPGCRPSASQVLRFVTRLAPDGTTAGPTQLLDGVPDCLYFACMNLLYDDFPNYQPDSPLVLRPDGTVLLAGANGTLASVDFSSSSRIACVADPADNVQLRTVAPGELVSIFGNDLAPAAPFTPPGGVAPSSSTLGVLFNGTPAPILYSSGGQINVQVPYEVAGQPTVQMQVIDTQDPLPLSESRTLGVAARQPSVFLTPAASASLFPGYMVCGGVLSIGAAAVALNADGTLNDCTNPAVAGSIVTVFANGLGQVSPALATGAVAAASPVALTPGVDIAVPGLAPMFSQTWSVPGSINGVAQVRFQVPKGTSSPAAFAVVPTLAGVVLRERLILVWTKPN
jgi:uncharacterized protein (TIGR03437 family)